MRRIRTSKRRAAVTVEFAFTFPLFVLFLFAGVEMSRLNMLRHAADNAAYEACRFGIVPGANVTEVEQKAQTYLDSVKVVNATINATPDPITEDTTDLTVDVVIPLAANSWIIPNFTDGGAIRASSSLRTERYRGIPSDE